MSKDKCQIYQSHKAFTLLELLLVVGILLVMTGLSGAFYARFLLANAVDITASQLVENIRKAQMYSMSGKADALWGVKFQNQVLSLYKVGDTYSEDYEVNQNINISGFTEVWFAKSSGVPNSSQNISLSAPNINKSVNITVNSKGVVNR